MSTVSMDENVCPVCSRNFPEVGFCPYDGIRLVPGGFHANSDVGTNLLGLQLDGRYEIDAKIGSGGMGVVYRARHKMIEKIVAIKVLRADMTGDTAEHLPGQDTSEQDSHIDDTMIQRFVQEARAASRIGHPNIIDVTDFGTTQSGLTYQVMEYLEGQTLSQLLTHGPLNFARAAKIIGQIAEALGAAHAAGIIHRDLKPDNIFLVARTGQPDFVKIVDFGIAKVVATAGSASGPKLTRAGTVFGTPEYMSPEQASGRIDVDLRTDLYALGVIYYEMLSGTVPLRGKNSMQTLAMQIMNAPPELHVHGLSANIQVAIMRCLQKDRSARFDSMDEFLAAVHPSGSTLVMPSPLIPTPLPPEDAQVQSAGIVPWLLLTVVLATGSAIGWFLWNASAGQESASVSVDAAIEVTQNPAADSVQFVKLRVTTNPVGGVLSVPPPGEPAGPNQAIPDGWIRRATGTVLTVQCSLSGYAPGQVTLSFDGRNNAYVCEMVKVPPPAKRCVEGLKNPFEECP